MSRRKLARYIVTEVKPAFGQGDPYYQTIRLKGIEATPEESDRVSPDAADIAFVHAYSRDDALVCYGIWRQQQRGDSR